MSKLEASQGSSSRRSSSIQILPPASLSPPAAKEKEKMENEPKTDLLPDWITWEIEHPVAMGDGRNNQMIKIGPTLVRLGYTEEQLVEIFHDMYDDLGQSKSARSKRSLGTPSRSPRENPPTLTPRNSGVGSKKPKGSPPRCAACSRRF